MPIIVPRTPVLFKWICTLLLAFPCSTYAFGLKTHLWIGQQILAETRFSCRVEIDEIPISIDYEVCESIRSHPEAFLSGVLGPDAFPDIITGQVTTHPGIKGDWQTNDWLMHVYTAAPPGPALAFASGYLVHAAGDAFAHTYVNSYAGDIFILEDDRRVELRHFLLEKYIDSKLPNFTYSPSMLRPPAEYLRDKLLHNPDASRIARASGVALHITSMHDIYRNVKDIAHELDAIEEDAAGFVAGLIKEIADNHVKLLTGEHQLKLARETLSAAEMSLEAEQKLYDAANKVFQDAAKALQDNLDLINTAGLEAKLARAAAEEAKRTGKEAVDLIASLQNRITDMEREIANIPTHITREVCRDEVVDTVCGVFCPLCGRVCDDVFKRVCRTVQEVNAAWAHLNDQITNARKDITAAQARAAQAAIDVTTNLDIEAAKLKEQASAQLLTAGLEAAKVAAQKVYEVHKARLDKELDATRQARSVVDSITNEIERLRKQIVDSESIKQALQDLITRSDVISGVAKKWQRDLDIAGREFIVASDRVSKGMLEGNSNFVSTYLEWWKCAGQAYTAVPIEFGQAVCEIENFMAKVDEEASKIVDRILPPPFNKVYADYLNIRNRIKKELKNAVNDAAIHIAKLASPDPTTGRFIELLARPSLASQGEMNSAFASAADSGKPLLVFEKVSDLIDADIGLRGDYLNPQQFSALKNGLVLSKLALMNMKGVKGLAWVLGADADRISIPAAPGRTSLLFDMVRSIDGNHQWQPYGLPYASANGAPPRPKDPQARAFGYGPFQPRPGFQLFIDDHLRHAMFHRVFQGPISMGLAKHLAGYPFPECLRHPFALAFKADGSATDRDDGCSTSAAAPGGRTPGERWRRFLNWLHLNPY